MDAPAPMTPSWDCKTALLPNKVGTDIHERTGGTIRSLPTPSSLIIIGLDNTEGAGSAAGPAPRDRSWKSMLLRLTVQSFRFNRSTFHRKMSVNTLPTRPSAVMSDFGMALQDALAKEMQEMQDECASDDETRDWLFRNTRAILKNNSKIQFAVRTGEQGAHVDALIAENTTNIATLLEKISNKPLQRSGQLGHAIQAFTETRMMEHFFNTGSLAAPSALQPCNDEEYMGAALGFAQVLSRYAVGRACDNDTDSIAVCRTIITQLNAKMLEFDFRNGPLRRKYDGLKYALKNIEDITYELSLLKDRARQGSVEIDAIRARMDAYDKLREQVIKDSRDVQKLAKQAIFSVHRGNLKMSRTQLDDALNKANAILALIVESPTLRNGAFSNSLEEWAEGILTLEWAVSKRVVPKEELKICNTAEYVGALSDFTGEIGRMAVAKAVKRDLDGVRETLQADVAISSGLQQVNVGGKFTKKVDAVNTNLRKIEDVVYELSMLRRGGKGKAREEAPVASKEEADE
eukprot:GSChrysophyteH2.ASY1.ANO1.1343.1 assembled CDS